MKYTSVINGAKDMFAHLMPCFAVALSVVMFSSTLAEGAVVLEEVLPLLGVERVTTYQGVRSREEIKGPDSPSTTLILPDENRMLEMYPASRSFEEKPLGAALGELEKMQGMMARDVRLLDEEVRVEKGETERIAGLVCTHYRFVWQARVSTSRGEKHYAISNSSCISHAPEALAARKALLRHVRAMAGRFGVVLHPERGDIWLFDIGRMLLGVPAHKLVMAQWKTGGFALSEEQEIDFGGALLEPMIRGVARQQAKEEGRSADEAEISSEIADMQEAMRSLQSPEFKVRMQEAMRELQDPELQAQLRQYISPEQIQAMQQTMGSMARGEGPAAALAGDKLHIVHRVTRIRLVKDRPGLMQPPGDYVWKEPSFVAPGSREPDARDGDGALSSDKVKRLIREVRTGRRPEGADENYAPMPRDAAPWMTFYRGWEGVPYQWGGTSMHGVDCSGLTQNAYQDVPHLRIPRTTAEQIKEGRRVSLRDARPGDLVFFDTGFRHVGVYVGQNKFFHASSSKGVTLSSLANAYWSRTFRLVRRIGR